MLQHTFINAPSTDNKYQCSFLLGPQERPYTLDVYGLDKENEGNNIFILQMVNQVQRNVLTFPGIPQAEKENEHSAHKIFQVC